MNAHIDLGRWSVEPCGMEGSLLGCDLVKRAVRDRKHGHMLVALLLRNAGRMVRDRQVYGTFDATGTAPGDSNAGA